ncbi:dephospho-CoA kinase [uncultured Treponema sp.]|uniref:dephospho-CoA kinase n=1 Tax=uncultured Treponema sp. TaxID=162155 RepID=UPI0025919C51|nr:dephospho-CoA kinase [uncultured Treponema sp.]
MILCVTGPMAAGKNVAASILEKKGFAAIDADVLGHRAVKECTEQILCEFSDEAQKRGVSLLSSDGTLNRRVLGSIVFESRELLARQEQIVYPVIRRLLAEFIRENAGKDIAVNATVLYKLPDMQNIIERILYIDAPLPLRFIRAMKRDKTGIIQIYRRFSSQKNLFAKYKNTNTDIKRVWNTGTRQSLERKIEKFLSDCRQGI